MQIRQAPYYRLETEMEGETNQFQLCLPPLTNSFFGGTKDYVMGDDAWEETYPAHYGVSVVYFTDLLQIFTCLFLRVLFVYRILSLFSQVLTVLDSLSPVKTS